MKLVPPSLATHAPWARLLTLIILTLSLFGCDYASKSAAKDSLAGSAAVAVAPSLLHGAIELRYVENDDIAFSMLHTLGIPRVPGILLALSCVAIAGIVFAVSRHVRSISARGGAGTNDRTTPVALALVAGGALGNVVDRARLGYVVDFIHVKGWPVFNVADIAVVAGMGLLFISQFRRRERPELRSCD